MILTVLVYLNRVRSKFNKPKHGSENETCITLEPDPDPRIFKNGLDQI